MRARYALTSGRGSHRHTLRQRGLAAGLTVREGRSGILLVADEATPVVIRGKCIVVGQAFGRGGEPLRSIDQAASADAEFDFIRSTHWGNFALFAEGAEQAYRDPSGSVAVYRIRGDAGDVFVSDAAFACALGLLESPRIDCGFAVHWLQFPYLRTSRAGLEKVRELLPGKGCRKSGGRWGDGPGWDPWKHAKVRAIDPEAAAADLRSVALDSVARQISPGRPLLQLSGGLDSSILAACLHQAGIDFTAVTFWARSADGDERFYARKVAKHFGVALMEIAEEELEGGLLRPAELTFRPASNPILLPLDKAIEAHRRDVGADLLVDGGGGDNLFCFLSSAAPVLDALIAAGPKAALAAASDVAGSAGCTFWQALGAAFRGVGRRRAWNEDRAFLKKDALLPRSDVHPWLCAPRFALPGKSDHVRSLVQIQHFLDRRLSGGTAALHPLMAQPLLETCLAIPTWLWVRGGVDRAIARQAFKDMLPAEILRRKNKGSLEGLFHRSFVRLRCELRDILLGGELRGLEILDAAAVEMAFAAGESIPVEDQMRISEMVALDLWLQSWRAREPAALKG